jgi:DNA polymerase-3 subunit alpha
VQTLAEVTAAARQGPLIARMAGSVAARKERKSARGARFAFVSLSDPTGLYEVTVFSDTLDTARSDLEPGCNVVLTVKAEMEGETLKLLANAVKPVEAAAAEAGPGGLRIHLDEAAAAGSVAALITRLGSGAARQRGPVLICVPDRQSGDEIDLELPMLVPLAPGLRGALRAVPGVAMVEDL